MANYSQMLLAALYNGTQGHVKSTDYFPLMAVRCTNADDPDASIAVSSGGDLAFTTDGTTADTTVNTTGTIDCSTPGATTDTLGEVLDLINASANWDAVLLGGIRSMGTDNLFYTTTKATAGGSTWVVLYGDSTSAQSSVYYYCFAVNGLESGMATDGDPDEGCQSTVNYINATINWSSAGSLKIYSCSQAADHLVDTITLADNTAKELGALSGPPIYKSRLGERLVIMLYSDASLTGAAGALRVQGLTIDWSGGAFKSGYVLPNAAG
jgi:hypothetical protein